MGAFNVSAIHFSLKLLIYVEVVILVVIVKLDEPTTSTTFKDPTIPTPTLTLPHGRIILVYLGLTTTT